MAHEARQYAQRNRQGSDWFSHGSDAVKPVHAAPAELLVASTDAPAEPLAASTDSPANDHTDSINESTAAEAAAPPARAQMIRPKCDSNEWSVSSCSSF